MTKQLKQIVVILLSIVLVGAGCVNKAMQINTDQSAKEQSGQMTELDDKEYCVKYKEDIKEEIDQDWGEDAYLGILFYSSSENSCLYTVEIVTAETSAEGLAIFNHYMLIDYFSNEILVDEMGLGLRDQVYPIFEAEINKYK